MITIVSWNVNRSSVAVSMLRAMGADLALLQEVGPGIANQLSDSIVGGPPRLEGTELRPVVATLSNRVSAEPLRPTPLPLSSLNEDEIAVSDPTTFAAARITPLPDGEASAEPSAGESETPPCKEEPSAVGCETPSHMEEFSAPEGETLPHTGESSAVEGEMPPLAEESSTEDCETPPCIEPFIVVSMYARWLEPHPLTRQTPPARRSGSVVINVYADASAHRIISDLSNLIGHTNPAGHRIIVAGDLNTIYGATKQSRHETPARAETIFSRMNALGLEFVGPRWPAGRGQTRDVAPDTQNVPTYLPFARLREMREAPENGTVAGNQLDYVFASRGFHEQVRVRAMNAPHEWGPSDHCRLLIEVE